MVLNHMVSKKLYCSETRFQDFVTKLTLKWNSARLLLAIF